MAPNLSIDQRSRILVSKVRKPNATIQQIADENEVPRSTAGEVLKLAMDRGTVTTLPIGGSSEKQSARDKRAVVRLAVTKHRFTPLKEVVNQEKLQIGETTLRKTLREEGYKRYARGKAKQLSDNNKRDRRKAALAAQDVNWDRVMFTDETDLQKHDVGSNAGYVTRRKGEAGNPAFQKAKNTTNYARIHVWAAVGYDYKSSLYQMPLKGGHSVGKKWVKAEALNGDIYGKFVYDVLGPCYNQFKLQHPRNCSVLCLEDNHGPHNGAESRAAHQALGIARFDHLPNSPDLNPIEVCWYILKRKMAAWDGMVYNFDDLFAIAQQCWNRITLREINRQVEKMPIRYRQVHKEHGGIISDFHHTPEE